MRSGGRPKPRPEYPPPSEGVAWPVRSRWRGRTPRRAAGNISGSPRHWCTRCRTPWRRWPAGALSEWRATLIVRESACLDVEDRRALDAELCADPTGLAGLGDARIAAEAKAIAYRLDPQAVVDRSVRAETERTVTIRPAPDNMTYVTALLPMAQGRVGLRRTPTSRRHLRRRPWPWPGHGRHPGRTGHRAPRRGPRARRGQSGPHRREPAGRRSPTPARIAGYGPVPAAVARRLIGAAVADRRSRATLRRLYKHPRSGALVAMESRVAVVSQGTGPVHRPARRHLPHPVLRCPDPPPRPRPTPRAAVATPTR